MSGVASRAGVWTVGLRQSALLSGARIVNVLLALARALVLGRTLDPGAYGVVSLAALIGSYGSLLHLGVRSSGFREIPILRGAGELEAARRLERVVWTSGMIFAGLGASVVLAAGLAGSRALAVTGGFVTGALLLILLASHAFQENLAYAWKCFSVTSIVQLVVGATQAVLVILFALYGGAPGVLVALVLAQIVAVAAYAQGLRGGLGWAIDAPETWRLIRAGGAIYAVSLLLFLGRTVDSWVVFGALDPHEWGLYAFALAAANLATLPYTEYVRVASQYGLEGMSQTGGAERFLRGAVGALEASGGFLGLGVGVGIVVVPAILGLLFPSYAAAAPMIQLLVGGLLVGLPATVLDSVLYVVGDHGTRLAAAALTVTLTTAGSVLAVVLGYGAVGVAAATVMATAVFVVVIGLGTRRRARAAGVAGPRLPCAVAVPPALVMVALLAGTAVSDRAAPGGLGAVGVTLMVFVTVYASGWRVTRGLRG